MTNFEHSVLFFLQMATILALCKLMGMLARRIGQPQVIGEMVAGILLGPSVFGYFFSGLQESLFPKSSMSILYTAAQVGLVFYMFLVGLDFNPEILSKRIRSAISISMAGIIAPFILGAALVPLLIQKTGFLETHIKGWQGCLFLGAAMSVTAFPVLARIISAKNLGGTRLGTLTLAAGSIDDVAAWCILAVTLACLKQDLGMAMAAIGGGALYAWGVLVLAKPLLRKLGAIAERAGRVEPAMLFTILLTLMLAAWFTDTIGIYAVFGAFLLGVAIPRGTLRDGMERVLEPLTVNFFLPLYFVYSGLNTRLSLVHSLDDWAITGLILLSACVGKGVACWAASRMNGESNKDSLAVGALMNARGLMELIMLNIGLEKHIITPLLFTIMVIMALTTTFMTSPLFDWIKGTKGRGEETNTQGNEAVVPGLLAFEAPAKKELQGQGKTIN